MDFWQSLTSDRYVLDIVKGYSLELADHDFLLKPPSCDSVFNIENTKHISDCIQELLSLAVIEPCNHDIGELISPIFLVGKSDGSHRKIINLKHLNKSVTYEHFKMENIASLCQLVTPGAYMTSVDLRKAYYSISVAKTSRKYLRFMWNGQLYQYTSLPMGLSSSPRVFTRLMKVLFTTFREEGMQCVFYLDDSTFVSECYDKCSSDTMKAVDVLTKAGFFINYDKSVLNPVQCIRFLGFMVDSRTMCLYLPADKVLKLLAACDDLLNANQFTIRRLSEVIGYIISCMPAFPHGKLHYRYLELLKIDSLRENNYNTNIRLDIDARSDLLWWKENAHVSGTDIRTPIYDVELFTDACLSGYGAVLNGVQAHSKWTERELALFGGNINCLELLAVLLAIQSFHLELKHSNVCVRIDNTTAVSYINNMGGTHSRKCNEIARQIWMLAIDLNINLKATHIPGIVNTEADQASRLVINPDIEIMINPSVFQLICHTFQAKPQIDLFASRSNNQLQCYASWRPDPNASFVDAFTIDWTSFNCVYIFPPFSLWGRLIQSIRHYRNKVTMIVVYPRWRGQHWYPTLVSLMTQSFNLPDNSVQSSQKIFRLAAGKI